MYPELDALAAELGWSEEELRRVTRTVEGMALPPAASPTAATAATQDSATLDHWHEPPSDAAPSPSQLALPEPAADRYQDLGLLGIGGMGEVRRVRDTHLNRVVAMKIVHAVAVHRPSSLLRFLEEAQATAQLQHVGIVPVHEVGRLPDGRHYFTMREVPGRHLGQVIASVHAHSGRDGWGVDAEGWSFRRLVDVFHRVCEAVAYAHGRQVVHRDLKPGNVMVAPHGEVLVVDWGLAKVMGRPDRLAEDGPLDPVVTARSMEPTHATVNGQVTGTPAYMPPEQAWGESARIDARSDVYCLGAMLYELLSGRPPYVGETAAQVLDQVRAGPPPPAGRAGLPVPDELLAACTKAMAREPAARFPDAAALGEAVASWLDGARRREQALAVVAEAAARQPQVALLRAEAAAQRAQAEALLSEVGTWQPEEDKHIGWERQDRAARLQHQAELAQVEVERLLTGALTQVPDLPEAHAALAAHYRAEHQALEAAGAEVARAEVLLRSHALALPGSHPDRAAHLDYLQGDGRLSLVSDPAGATVRLLRYELVHRRLRPVFLRELGPTPLLDLSLPMGRYLCELRHPGHAPVAWPVLIARRSHHHCVPPGETEPQPVRLPRAGELGPDDCYVAAGWALMGGDPLAASPWPAHQVWVDGFVMRRFPVTNREYLVFLDDLVAAGRRDEALAHAPRERAAAQDALGTPIYGFEDGRFFLRPDADGDQWHPDWPVTLIAWSGAVAYAEWQAARTGLPWRLPGELEWEKAARGVDGRAFPWGDFADPSWCNCRGSHRGRPMPAVVDSFPVDESPYGVRGMAGNAREWCGDRYLPEGPAVAAGRAVLPSPEDRAEHSRVNRGGCWSYSPTVSRAAGRDGGTPARRGTGLGFRLVRSVP